MLRKTSIESTRISYNRHHPTNNTNRFKKNKIIPTVQILQNDNHGQTIAFLTVQGSWTGTEKPNLGVASPF